MGITITLAMRKEKNMLFIAEKGTLDAKEQIILDGNELSKGYDYFAIGSRSISPNNEWLAYMD